VPLSPAVLAEIGRYGPRRSGPVFPRGDGQHGHNTAQRVSAIVGGWLRENRFGFTLHQCRHRFATDVYRDTRDLRLVQDLMGHARPESTAIYTVYAVRAAKDAVDRTSRQLEWRNQ
jgi:integrase